jgi:hypothetical protein
LQEQKLYVHIIAILFLKASTCAFDVVQWILE